MAGQTKDPVCGMSVDKAQGRKESHQGQDCYFCSDSCREKFKADPSRVRDPSLV